MTGLAVGSGISLDDFWRMTPDEAAEALKASQRMERTIWDAARTVAAVSIQPHLRKGHKISPTDIIRLPWDEQKGSNAKPKGRPITREEAAKRTKKNKK